MRRRRILIAAAGTLAALSGLLGVAVPAGAAAASCHTVHLPVTLPAGVPDPAPGQVVSAFFCTPGVAAPGHPIQVLVPGATYSSAYWNWPQDPALYNWASKALATGSAVFGYDRLGTGASTSPPAADLTVQSDANVLHQIISWARHTAGYTDVNLIGHSMGSAIAAQDAGTWPGDASRLVVTGMLNYDNPAVAGETSTAFYPASDDPQFPHAGPGYLTTVPGGRSTLAMIHKVKELWRAKERPAPETVQVQAPPAMLNHAAGPGAARLDFPMASPAVPRAPDPGKQRPRGQVRGPGPGCRSGADPPGRSRRI